MFFNNFRGGYAGTNLLLFSTYLTKAGCCEIKIYFDIQILRCYQRRTMYGKRNG